MAFDPAASVNRLYIANLGEGMDQDWLTKTFSQFSPVQKVFVMHDRKSKQGRFSAFVTLSDQPSCQRAIDALHNSPCLDNNNFTLVVRLSEPAGAKQPQRQMMGGYPDQGGAAYGNQWAGNAGYNAYGGGKGAGGYNVHQGGAAYGGGGGGGWNQGRGAGGYQPQQQQPQQQQQQQAAAPSATGNVIYSGGKAWYEATDPSSRKTYYYTSAGETTWDRPAEEGGKKKGGYQNQRGRPY
ncbi:hypothetical protein DIPPA_20171 [Diplonema papillatum]|nr:hypothetical protein DIPPA_20171 [Diplonema papillatum]